jgi:hypothetical protein
MAALAGGSLPFLATLILFLVGAIIALYTRRGSGMDHHPYHHVHAGAPAADLPCEDYSGSDRTATAEREVLSLWRRRRLAQDPASVAAQLAEARSLRRRQRSVPSNGLPVRSPVPPLR